MLYTLTFVVGLIIGSFIPSIFSKVEEKSKDELGIIEDKVKTEDTKVKEDVKKL
jgi:hypothetical protein